MTNEEIEIELKAMGAALALLEALSIESKQRAVAWLSSCVQQEHTNQWKKEDANRYSMLGVNGFGVTK